MEEIEKATQHLTKISQEQCSIISQDYFNQKYGYRELPVIFKNAFKNLKIKNVLQLNELSKKFLLKERLVNIQNQSEELMMNLQDYLDYNSPDYYFVTNRLKDYDVVIDPILMEVFPCWYSSTKISNPKINLNWVYVGIKNSFSKIHIDLWSTSAWNYLTFGRKIWLVYPKTFTEYISKHKEEFELYRNGKLNHSLFQKEQKPMVITQRAGELVFIPSNMYHGVFNVEDTISITGNFVNQINYDFVRSHFRKSGSKQNKIFIESIIKEGFANVKRINYADKN